MPSLLVRQPRALGLPLSLSCLLLACGGHERANDDTDAAVSDRAAIESDAALRGEGCDLQHAGTAYRADKGVVGVAIEGKGAAPIACTHVTGYGSAENTLAIDDDGTVFVAPMFFDEGVGLLRTKDRGKTWTHVVPEKAGGAKHGRPQPYLFMDSASQRLLFATSKATSGGMAMGFDLSISDDAGETWSAQTFGEDSLDWVKIVGGPAVTSKPTGGGNVLYAAAPTPISTPSPFSMPLHQQVLRSLDDGDTWVRVDDDQLSLRPTDHGCATSEWVIYGDGVVTDDGSVYFGFRRCAEFGIAASHDEGKTWKVSSVPGAQLVAYGGLLSHQELYNLMTPSPLATDSDGNLYAVWADADDTLRYAVSHDGAKTWSVPLAINAPDARHVAFGAIVTREPGTIAIAYYGSKDGVAYDGYIAESRDALTKQPTFWSVAIDNEGPLFSDGFDMGYTNVLKGGDLIEIAQVRYAPNGDLWAAFVQDMCPGIGSAGPCDWDLATHTDSPYQAVIGRLVHR